VPSTVSNGEVTPVDAVDTAVTDSCGEQDPPLHSLHVPLLHTPVPPHAVPSGALTRVSVQTAPASVQDSAPTWHSFDGTQLAPASHATQLPASQSSPQKPLLHVRPPPHAVPSGTLAKVSTHDGAAPVQDRAPA